MFNVLGQGYPGMFVLFIDWERGRRKSWFCECTNWDGNRFFVTFQLIMNGRAAMRAETESSLPTFIAYPNILRRQSIDLHTFSPESRLSTKDAARSPLTIKTVANRYANWVFGCDCGKLPTTTSCNSFNHKG